MPVLLRDFINTHQGKNGVDSLIEKMRQQPPLAEDTQASKYYYDKYKELAAAPSFDRTHQVTMKLLLEYLLYSVAPIFKLGQTSSFFQQNLLLEQVTVFLQAFLFDLTSMGNCANRSTYAAFKLHDLFENTDLKIIIKSAKDKDQYVVYLGNKSMGWFIYDPLTNPELVFTFKEYIDDILPLIPLKSRPTMPLSVPVNPTLCKQYEFVANKLQRHLNTSVDDMQLSELRGNVNIVTSMKLVKGVKNINTSLELACDELKRQYGTAVKFYGF